MELHGRQVRQLPMQAGVSAEAIVQGHQSSTHRSCHGAAPPEQAQRARGQSAPANPGSQTGEAGVGWAVKLKVIRRCKLQS